MKKYEKSITNKKINIKKFIGVLIPQFSINFQFLQKNVYKSAIF